MTTPKQYVQLIGTSRTLIPEERLDLLVHAAAQLSDDVLVRIEGTGPDRDRLARLAHAYGIRDRVTFTSSTTQNPGKFDFLVYTSRWNLDNALLPPGTGGATSVLVGDDDRSATSRVRLTSTPGELVETITAARDAAAAVRTDDDIFSGQRVGVVTNIPTHYRVPLFNDVAERIARAGGSFRVFFLARTYARRSWMTTPTPHFDHEFIDARSIGISTEWKIFLPTRLRRSLREYDPTLLVTAGFSPVVSGRVVRYALKEHVPVGLWSGEIPSRSSSPLRRARSQQRRVLVRKVDFGMTYGAASGEYLRKLRVDLPFVYARNTINSAPTPARSGHGHPLNVLAVAEMSSRRKAIDILIDAFRLIGDSSPLRLTIVGGGPLLNAYIEQASGLEQRIRFVGVVDPKSVAAFYADADVFAFPSRAEIFGLVLVEAMAAGLPAVCSTAPGAVADLCAPEENCVLVPDDQPENWAAALERLAQDPGLRDRLGGNAARTIHNRWTMAHSVDAFVAGLRLGLIGKDPFEAGVQA